MWHPHTWETEILDFLLWKIVPLIHYDKEQKIMLGIKNNCLPTNQVKDDIRKPLWQVLQIVNFELVELKFSENEVLIKI